MQQKMEVPKNQYALVVKLLMENTDSGVTMITAMRDKFHKFQSRLLEIEKSLDGGGKPRSLSLKIRRLPVTTKNRFGHSCTFTNYKALSSYHYLTALFNKLNKNGLNQPKK